MINKKVKNATTIEYDGITFDSILECEFYKFLQNHKIRFKHHVTFELVPTFNWIGMVIRPMTITIDFFLLDYNLYIDTKGYPNDVFPYKVKLWKYKAVKEQWMPPGNEPAFWYIRNKGQFYLVLNLSRGQGPTKSDLKLLMKPTWKKNQK